MKISDLKTEEEKEQLDEISKFAGTALGGYAGYVAGGLGGFAAGGIPGAVAGAIGGSVVGAKLGRTLAKGTKGEELDKFNKLMAKQERDLKKLSLKIGNAKDEKTKEMLQGKLEATVKRYDSLFTRLEKEFKRAK